MTRPTDDKEGYIDLFVVESLRDVDDLALVPVPQL